MPGYMIIATLKLIRSPILKTRKWAQKKVADYIKKRREKGGQPPKAGLAGEDAWMYFGEQVIRHDLVPIFDENLKGLATREDLTVPSSELAIHQRAAGFHIQAFAWDKPRHVGYVVYQPSDRSFGYISGLEHEVLPTSLTALVERTFGKEYSMKSDVMRGIHGGEWSRGVVGGETGDPRRTGVAIPSIAITVPTIPIAIAGAAAGIASGVTTAVASDYITERRRRRQGHDVGATESTGPVFDPIIKHINEYRSVNEVPKPLLIIAKRYIQMHRSVLQEVPLDVIYQDYGPIMGTIIELEMSRGYATGQGAEARSPKPVPVYTEQRSLGLDELVFRSRPYKDMRDMPPDLIRAVRDYVRTHPEDIRGMSDREMVMRFGWGFYHAAEPEIAAVQGSTMRRHGRVDLAGEEEERPSPQYRKFVREAATDKILERYHIAQRENWSGEASPAFTPSEVQEAVGDLLYLTDGTAFVIGDLNRRELENALVGLNISVR